jgi:serine/threonine-protein kinase PknG
VTEEILLCHDEPVGPTGYCDICGRKRVAAAPRTVALPTSLLSAPASTTTIPMTTGKRTLDAEPGGAAEFARLPPLEMPDPARALLTDPHYPENRQRCGNPVCHEPVGRAHDGQPALTAGFCGKCGLPFDFAPKLNPGDRLDDRYDIVGWLAHGGLGWVYLAKDTALGGVYVAVKGVINPFDAQARDLADVERDVLIRLEHQNIVRIGNFVHHPNPRGGRSDDYIVMDYVNGLTLRQMIQRGAELTVTHVITYGRAILAAMDYLHSEGLLYCDMKPDNVIHGVRGIKVVDLGAARVIDDTKSAPVGTQGYMVGREEIEKYGLTMRSDIHTVGRTMQELLAASSEPRDSGDVSFGIESLSRLLDRAVAGFHQRFGTVAEMSEQLDGVRREILALQGQGPLPAPSQRFDSTPELLDSGLGAIPGLDRWTTANESTFHDGLPSPQEAASRLPVPWAEAAESADAAESAALFLDTARAANPRRLLDKLNTFGSESVDVEFARVRAYVELRDPEAATAALGKAEQLLGTTAATDWRVRWHYGLLALARGKLLDASGAFDRVYATLPGEDAPKLALGFCYEHLGPDKAEQSRRCYEAVWLRDRAQASAAFGLARLRLRGRGSADRKAAVHILDGVRPVSRHYDAAKIAAVRIYVASLPSGPPSDEDLAEAAKRLPELYLDSGDDHGEFRERLTAVVSEAVLDWVRALGGDERPARLDLELCFRRLAGRARDADEHGIFVDRANSVRPKSRI